jgi:hypothetical protein
MVKKFLLALLLGASVLAWSLPADAKIRPLDPFQECGLQCDWWGPNVWCSEPSDPRRCCYDSGDVDSSACGEVMPCSACGGDEGGGF